jgi:hypothetical protein
MGGEKIYRYYIVKNINFETIKNKPILIDKEKKKVQC